ncbi:MAG: hypothetical protein GAK45_01179 [Pseudomonas citronellolis]|nr:MAG: hypothetical protein GAK45_01179 [Pseudomonas citronellolis]
MSLLYVASTADTTRWRALPYPGVAVRPAQAPTLMATGTFSLVLVELPAAHPQLLPLCRAPRGAAALTVLLQDAGNPALCLRAGADQCLPASVSLREMNNPAASGGVSQNSAN